MYAKNLERILDLLSERCDVSPGHPGEHSERFKSLRDYAMLPRGRERREEQLSNRHIANAVLGLISLRPGWAGLGAIILADLRPVGSIDASFFGAETLSDAVQILLASEDARKDFLQLTITLAETGTNSNGGATLLYQSSGARRQAFFVSKMAVSLLSPGREVNFDPEKHRLNSAAAREMTFMPKFFHELAKELEIAKLFPKPVDGDGSEYDAEEAEKERYRNLGVRPNSRFINIGVDNQVIWPKEEKLIKFDRYTLVLMPKTKDNVQSVHMDLVANRLDDRDAMTVINRFLSIMAWCDDNFAVAQGGWSGNPVPVPVPKRDLAFTTATNYIFDRKFPASEDAMRALALYREARNAQQNSLVSYAVLNFYKIVEMRYQGKETLRKWFQQNFEKLREEGKNKDDVQGFLQLCANIPPHKYIHDSCRIAVAHAGKHSKSDPDDAHEIVRLHTAARIMRLLARRFIKTEFAVSGLIYSGD
ncbi:methylamine utilization protein MauJ [Terrarubrum flagellatum]|uniref:methylamine utilization protein MauJ n=1 Tax=Terrirubrum flagellatum TaxID=2895980 RepID=UPI003145347D